MTLPMTLNAWLTATNLYASVANETSILPGPDPQRLLMLIPTTNVDIVLLVNSSFNANLYPTLASRPSQPPTDASIHFADHYVLMTAPFSLDGAWVNIECWTWEKTVHGWVGTGDFGRRYFGPIIATAR